MGLGDIRIGMMNSSITVMYNDDVGFLNARVHLCCEKYWVSSITCFLSFS